MSINILSKLTPFDAYVRHSAVLRHLNRGSNLIILDVGSGGRSYLMRHKLNVISLDIKLVSGVDIVADARYLPFRDNSIDQIVSTDCIEHIPSKMRKQALCEMIRCAKKQVLIHSPLENGRDFQGKRYDLLFYNWLTRYLKEEHVKCSTFEHIICGHPHPTELITLGFRIIGTFNVHAMLISSVLRYGLPILGVLITYFFSPLCF